jgi:hypothetical protein
MTPVQALVENPETPPALMVFTDAVKVPQVNNCEEASGGPASEGYWLLHHINTKMAFHSKIYTNAFLACARISIEYGNINPAAYKRI